LNFAITGVSGLLGAHLAAVLSAQHRVIGFDRHSWWGTRRIELHTGDLDDADACRRFIDAAEPDVLIHCAAMVNVDACEERPEEAYRINGAIPGLLARSVPANCTVVYVTTDGIFRGDDSNRKETDLPCPRTVYGRSKLHGEWETALATPRHLILRTNFYGWSSGRKSSSGEWLYAALANRQPITLFDDFWFTPIYVVELVERILALIASRTHGTFHLVGADRLTKHEFGRLLARAAGFSMDAVRRGSIDSATLRAPRPRDMSLDGSQAARVSGLPSPSCAAGIGRFVADRGRTVEQRVEHLGLA